MVRIRLENANKIFQPDVHVLKDISLEIKDKEFMVLVGPSGCGKSTCLNIIAGLEYVTDGKVFFDDIDVTFLPPKQRKIAMVFQSYALYPHRGDFAGGRVIQQGMEFNEPLIVYEDKVHGGGLGNRRRHYENLLR